MLSLAVFYYGKAKPAPTDLFVSRTLLYRHISALNEKTGTRSRIGLIQFNYNWEENKKYLSIGGNLPCKTEISSV